MSEEYRNGVNAAAALLRATAADYEEIADRRESFKGAQYDTRTYRAETAVIRQKAQLLRGQASRIQAELTP